MKKLLILLMLAFALFINVNHTVEASEIVGADVIHKQANQILTINDIKSMYNSELGQVLVENDTYTGYGNVPGLKTVDMVVESLDLTIYRKTISIYVIEELGNVKAVTDYKNIHLRTNQVLTPTQIVYVLENTGYVEITASTQMSILNDTYTENAEIPGTYVFEFQLINSAGLDEIYSSIIYVADGSNLFVPDVIFEAPVTQADKIIEIIKDVLYFAIFLGVCYILIKIVPKLRNRGFRR